MRAANSRRSAARAAASAIEAGLAGGEFPVAVGGGGWTTFEQVLVHEQYGQVTGGLWSFIPGAYGVLAHADPEQRRRYLEPSLRGERFGAYAVTEPNAGSDARTLETTAVRNGTDWVLNGEKWFVTGPDNTDFMIVQAVVIDGGDSLPTLFLVDYDTPGVRMRPILRTCTPTRIDTRSSCSRTSASRTPARLGAIGAATTCRQRVVRRRANPHRGPLRRRDGAPADPRRRLGDGASAVRQPHLRLPGRQLPPRRLGRRRLRGPAADARGRLARGLRGGPEGRARQGVAGQAVRRRGGVHLRGPRRPGLRRARLHARESGRALPARAARRSDLGGDERDPAR